MALPDFKRAKLSNVLANSSVGAMIGIAGGLYISSAHGDILRNYGLADSRAIVAIGSSAGAAFGALIERIFVGVSSLANSLIRICRFALIAIGKAISQHFVFAFRLWFLRRRLKDGTLSEGDYKYIVRKLNFHYFLKEEPPEDASVISLPINEASLRVVPNSPSKEPKASGD